MTKTVLQEASYEKETLPLLRRILKSPGKISQQNVRQRFPPDPLRKTPLRVRTMPSGPLPVPHRICSPQIPPDHFRPQKTSGGQRLQGLSLIHICWRSSATRDRRASTAARWRRPLSPRSSTPAAVSYTHLRKRTASRWISMR